MPIPVRCWTEDDLNVWEHILYVKACVLLNEHDKTHNRANTTNCSLLQLMKLSTAELEVDIPLLVDAADRLVFTFNCLLFVINGFRLPLVNKISQTLLLALFEETALLCFLKLCTK